MRSRTGSAARAAPPGEDGRRLAAAARATVTATVAAGVEAYDRDRMLPRLVRATPGELTDTSPQMRRAILARLARALRAERNRGRAGHWTYDLNRHIALRQAYAAERQLADRGQRREATGRETASRLAGS